jgi:hypothetical protein
MGSARDNQAGRDPRHFLAAGLAERRNACGAGVRPQREPSRTGQSVVKQENPRVTKGIPVLQGGEDVNFLGVRAGSTGGRSPARPACRLGGGRMPMRLGDAAPAHLDAARQKGLETQGPRYGSWTGWGPALVWVGRVVHRKVIPSHLYRTVGRRLRHPNPISATVGTFPVSIN